MKKRFFAFILLLALLVLPSLTALASGGADAYVIDERGKLSSTQIEQLSEKAKLIEAEQGFTPMFAIVEDAGGDVTAYLERLYTEHHGGENGLIMGYSNVENKWSAAAFGLALDSLTDSDIEQLWDVYDKSGTYDGGISDYFDSASRVYAERTGGRVPEAVAASTPSPTKAPAETAAPVATAAPVISGNRVEDAADLLTPEQEEALAQKLDEYSRKHDCDIVVITAKSLGSKSARLFAADYYELCGYNMSGGMVMMVCPEARDYAFVGTGKCYSITNDSKVIDHLEDVVVADQLKYDHYNTAFNVFADKCDEFLTNVENGKQPYKKNLISTTFAAIGSAVVGLISGGSAAGGMASKLKSVHHKYNASDYVEKGSLRMTDQSEMFLYTNVVKTEIPRDDDRSSGSSGGFSSSSGSSWSGSSGKY
ncbi:MAG: TPM domain-containing protein [Clostridia bacterium]|nr:TPM domain-containing protein [Clostridia bacterium]